MAQRQFANNTEDVEMALRQNLDHGGAIIQDCYIKVEYVEVQKESLNATVVWRPAQDGAPLRHKTFTFDYNISGENPLRQAYLHLKQVDEFAGAVDI